MVHLNVHGSVNCRYNCFSITTVVFVALLNRFRLPVRPVDGIFEDCKGKNVVETGVGVFSTAEDNTRIAAFQICDSDIIFTSVRPKYFVRFVGNGQRVRPTFKIRVAT